MSSIPHSFLMAEWLHRYKHTQIFWGLLRACVCSNFAWWWYSKPSTCNWWSSISQTREVLEVTGAGFICILCITRVCVFAQSSPSSDHVEKKKKKQPTGTSLWQQAICHHHNECWSTSRGVQAHKHTTTKLSCFLEMRPDSIFFN